MTIHLKKKQPSLSKRIWIVKPVFLCVLQIIYISGLFGQVYKSGPAEKGYAGYLFAYFKGNALADEALCYAISTDGYNYRALNNNQPVLDSKLVSSTRGIRDPYILRGGRWTNFLFGAYGYDLFQRLGCQ